MIEAANKAILADNVELKEEHIPKEVEETVQFTEEEMGHMIEAATVEANVCEDEFKETKAQEAANTEASAH